MTWKAHPTFTGYEVSDDGGVRSVDRIVPYRNGPPHRRRGVLLSQSPHPDGYRTVSLSVLGRIYTRAVHVLVAETFHGPRPTDRHEVRHLNGDPGDSRAENLKWGTGSENCADTIRHGRHSQASKTHCPQGHEYTPENIVRQKGRNGRKCLECSRAHARKTSKRYYAENRELIRAKAREKKQRMIEQAEAVQR